MQTASTVRGMQMNQHCGTGLRCGCAILQSCAEGKLLDSLDLSTNCALVAVCNAQTDANGTKLVVDRSMHAFEHMASASARTSGPSNNAWGVGVATPRILTCFGSAFGTRGGVAHAGRCCRRRYTPSLVGAHARKNCGNSIRVTLRRAPSPVSNNPMYFMRNSMQLAL